MYDAREKSAFIRLSNASFTSLLLFASPKVWQEWVKENTRGRKKLITFTSNGRLESRVNNNITGSPLQNRWKPGELSKRVRHQRRLQLYNLEHLRAMKYKRLVRLECHRESFSRCHIVLRPPMVSFFIGMPLSQNTSHTHTHTHTHTLIHTHHTHITHTSHTHHTHTFTPLSPFPSIFFS